MRPKPKHMSSPRQSPSSIWGSNNKPYVDLHFGNVTYMGPKAIGFLKNPDHQCKIFAAVETHAMQARALKMNTELKEIGWKALHTYAQPSTKSSTGSHGGTMIAARSWLACQDVRAGLGDTPAIQNILQEALDWTPALLNLRGMQCLLIVCYMDNNIGFVGANKLKLCQMGVLIRLLRLPFLVLGDWNQPPPCPPSHRLAQGGWG